MLRKVNFLYTDFITTVIFNDILMDTIKKTDHFYLIDGSGYIFRAYYALPPLTRKSDGLPTGAVSGFCSMLFKLLEDSKSDQNLQKPTHFAVIFDSARKTFRNDIYSD